MHFYTEKDGKVEPRHFVPMAKDPSRNRPSRVTDARKAAKNGERWFPSVTTILNMLDKPALVNWKVDKHLEQVHALINNNAELRSDDLEGFKKLIKAQTQEALDSAPKAGTDIHNVLEDFWREGKLTGDEIKDKICWNVRDLLLTNCDQLPPKEWECEKYFLSEVGYAGCADLVSKNGGFVIDYKSKQEADKFKPGKMQYPEHVRQLAAYGKAMCKEGFRAANIFICLETGEVDFCEASQEDLEKGYGTFLDCLSIYKRETFNPYD